MRERVVQTAPASGKPFDNGLFELIEERADAPWPEDDRLRYTLDRVEWPPGWLQEDPELPDKLREERDRAVRIYSENAAA